MILAVDVHYGKNRAVAAGVAFECWTGDIVRASYISTIEQVSGYIPGQFYKRELPCILRLLTEHHLEPETILIDGYVYLDAFDRPGMGRHLYDALQHKAGIIGVAKSRFRMIPSRHEVYRGGSRKPLFVTCTGVPLSVAKAKIASMHGKFRIPTLLRTVDQLARNLSK